MPADWIEAYLDYTAEVSSPRIFRLWAGIAAVAGAMERRCWLETRQGAIYPNLFILLVSSPGIGKTEAIKVTEKFWYASKKLIVAPKSLTKAALVDALKESLQTIVTSKGLPYEYHSLLVPSSEFGVLVPAHDMEFLSVLNDIYDNPPTYREKRRHFNAGKDIDIINPQLNILAGTQPGFMAHILPEEAWTMGFTSRIVMVYAGSPPPPQPLFDEGEPRDRSVGERFLGHFLADFASIAGRFRWGTGAQRQMELWHQAKLQPIPEHSKLTHYIPRRILHALKLCMVSAMSRSHQLEISSEDVTRAQDWLIEAESAMPDIFREMVQKSDQDVITELHFWMWRAWLSDNKQPIHEKAIYKFLLNRVPSANIGRVIEVSERAGVIKRVAGTNDLWEPKPRNQFGME